MGGYSTKGTQMGQQGPCAGLFGLKQHPWGGGGSWAGILAGRGWRGVFCFIPATFPTIGRHVPNSIWAARSLEDFICEAVDMPGKGIMG